MSCGIGRRLGSDLVLLWLWRRLAATALIRPLAWKHPYAESVALIRQKIKKNNLISKMNAFYLGKKKKRIKLVEFL